MRTAIILTGFMILAVAWMPAETAVAAEQEKIKDTTKEAAKETAPPAPEAEKKSDYYEYTSVGRRDPFTSLIQKKTSDKEKGATALESYESAEIKLIAILWDKNKYYAVISLPDGKSYTVFEGVKVGARSGVIKRISKDTMIIAERFKDARGRISPKEIVLKLRTEEE